MEHVGIGNAVDFTRLAASRVRLPTLTFDATAFARCTRRARYFARATESRIVTLTGNVRSIGHCVP